MAKRTASILVTAAILLPAVLAAGVCGENSPAVPVPECRSDLDGSEVGCGEPGAIRLWPETFRPGLPAETFPLDRDSTQWISVVVPGAQTGMELFHSVDALGDYLYAAYNAGVQVWHIGDDDAEDPQRIFFRDGWLGAFLDFPLFGEVDFFIDDISAIRSKGDVLVALSGKSLVGFSLWRHTTAPAAFDQLYQDGGNDSRQVRTVDHAGNLYAFAAGDFGVFVYDLTAAEGLASPCLDDAGTVCPGVFLGKVGTTGLSRSADILQRGADVYVARSGGTGTPVEIWEVSDPANPGAAVTRFSGLGAGAQGLALFELEGVAYLGVVERDGGDWRLAIYDVDECLDADGCVSLGAPSHTRALGAAVGSPQFLTFSRSFGTPFLYYGANEFGLSGSKVELLLDLSELPGGTVTEITDGAGIYSDPCDAALVDYWGDYYPRNTFGLRNVRPLVGKFHRLYFYRAAFGVFDVHVRETGLIFLDGFESGDTSAW